jgi:hypothetical protein
VSVEPHTCLLEGLFDTMRTQGDAALRDRLAGAVAVLAPRVDSVVLSQFSMAPAAAYLQEHSPVPVLSAPHSSARRLKELLGVPAAAA